MSVGRRGSRSGSPYAVRLESGPRIPRSRDIKMSFQKRETNRFSVNELPPGPAAGRL